MRTTLGLAHLPRVERVFGNEKIVPSLSRMKNESREHLTIQENLSPHPRTSGSDVYVVASLVTQCSSTYLARLRFFIVIAPYIFLKGRNKE